MRLGLRPQLLLLVAVLLGVGLVPLFWTAATISRISLERAERHAAMVLGRSIARSFAEGELERPLGDPILGVTLVRADGSRWTTGRPLPRAAEPVALSDGFEERSDFSRIIWSAARGNVAMAYVAVAVEREPHRARSFLGLMALYMGLLGLGLLLAIHLAITWLIVRPLDALGRAARRVAFGGRGFELPQLPAKELTSLGQSLNTMTEKLLADEQALRAHLDEIHQANERLKLAQERLIRSERLASVGRLAAGLAHEVGNPITAMIGLEELLLSGGVDPEQQRDFLQRIHRETERIHRILRDLLDFARPTQGATEASPEPPGDVAVSIDETLALIRPQKVFKTVAVEATVPANLPLVVLSRPKLVQVLLNLLLNAADALATQGNREGRVVIAAGPSERGVSIALRDNGPGVATAVREHLFEPFVTTKEVGRGTGLGLAVCRGLVESVGGTIQLEASSTEGSCFVVELPAQAGQGELSNRDRAP